jgi:predicted nuclease of predicted toxin-antitoxin system
MRILLDENLPFALITFLEERGHAVFHIKKLGKSGIKNGEVSSLPRNLSAGCSREMRTFRTWRDFYGARLAA